ncbi:MAG: MFS transporter [Bifidobacterium psychraerophilum]|uniref:MFS transporter n=1 Tax=Bifidobacterium psychraerophilum TaxID=218140 RepID=UPI0039EC092F
MSQEVVTTRAKLAILAAGALTFIGILTETSLTVAFPALITELGKPLSTIQWLTSGYLLTVTFVMSMASFLVQRFRARTLFVFAALACTIGTLVCALAPSFTPLLLGRLLQAVATGISTPLMFHIVFETIPLHKLGTYVGIASMVTSFAPALGPTYGGILTHAMSWRMIFWFILPVVLASLALGIVAIRLPLRRLDKRFDLYGFITLCVLMYSLIEVCDRLGNAKASDYGLWAFVLTAVLCLTLFIWHMVHGKQRILDFRLLARPILGLRATNFFLLQFTNIGMSFLIPIFVQNAMHMDALSAGLIVLPGSLVGSLVSPIAGKIYDRRGATLPLVVGNASMLIGALLLWYFTHSLTAVSLMCLYVFVRFGFNCSFGNTMSDAAKHVQAHEKGDINALFNTLQQFAGSLGTAALSAVITHAQIVNPDATSAVRDGGQSDFLLLSVLAACGLICALLAARISGKQQAPTLESIEV